MYFYRILIQSHFYYIRTGLRGSDLHGEFSLKLIFFVKSVFETPDVIKICKCTVFSSCSFCQIYRVTDEAFIAETMVWPNFFLMNVFFALKGSKLFIITHMRSAGFLIDMSSEYPSNAECSLPRTKENRFRLTNTLKQTRDHLWKHDPGSHYFQT